MRRLKIFSKLFISYAAIALVSVLILFFLFYSILKKSLIERTADQLSSINILKINQVENHFSRTQKTLTFIFKDLERSSIASITRKLKETVNLYEYQNAVFVDSNFTPIFSVNGDTSFLVILNKEEVKNSLTNKSFKVYDASAYNPEKTTWLLYSIPMLNEQNSITGYILVKEDFGKIQRILFELTGLGSTGESYLIGKDSLMRSVSRFFPKKAPLTIKVNSKALMAFQKGSYEVLIKDYREVDVLSVHRKLKHNDLSWVLVTEIDLSEAMQPVYESQKYLILITCFIMLQILAVSYFVSSAISTPIRKLKNLILSLSKGIIPENGIEVKSMDEVGEITAATNQLRDGLQRTTAFANQIGSGNFKATFSALSDQDTLGRSLISMRDELKAFNERELRLVREKGAALMEGQENERKRIIMELHDGIGQLLTVVKLRLEAMEDQDELKEEIKQLVNETIAEVRRISYNVMPSALVDFGLEAALKGLCQNVKKYSDLTVDFSYVNENDTPLNFEISIAVFRIVQEGLNNIIKHSKASKAILHVEENQESMYLMLKDDGIGFSREKINSKRGFGLTSMKERAKLLNGDMDIHSTEGKGTIMEVNIPVNRLS